ncbi:g-protein alpha subunit [Teladorsagia circumcincta]|uniref:G-protein alpha subunit n=1 Tax=Teladorsagia circumcincta TaxID=45464 RepID=A0A2G9V0J0_TELCI|nr:g-protein alpha subunit [Teladorsagia circumcincta]
MGCGPSSQVDTVTTDNKPDSSPTPEVANQANGNNEVAVKDDAPLMTATTMDELNTPAYTLTRLLLLGAAESGKTTLLEQIRLLYKQNYSDTEFMHRKAFIYNNILISIRKLINRMQETNTAYDNPENAKYAELIMGEEETQFACFTHDVCEAIQRVWHDTAVQKIYERRSEINLNDSSKYFLENLASINTLDFTPTPRDLIMSYVPTVGVQNVIFSVDNHVFQLFDIGGQRIDRRKWATMYDGISAIFFCIAISEYDQMMDEDPQMVTMMNSLNSYVLYIGFCSSPVVCSTVVVIGMYTNHKLVAVAIGNRLQDALALLEKINKEPKFEKTPFLLFLNEVDVFREKLPLMPLQDHWPDYKGNSEEDALKFVEELTRKSMSGRDDSLIRIYHTCMINTDDMSKILEKAFHAILKAT